MPASELHESHLYSTYFAPRGRKRIFNLGIQIAQLYLSPFDRIIGVIGEAGSGKSALIKGMFPGLELTNDDDGVNVRPLPLLEQDSETGFFTPHTYHMDVRFEMGFTNINVLTDAVLQAIRRGKRVVIEHFDLIYPHLQMNANLLIGVGEEIVITRPTLFGPQPGDIYERVYRSLPYRLMAHTAEDLCELYMTKEQLDSCIHSDVHHGFIMAFQDQPPEIDLRDMERHVRELIAQNLPVSYADETHIRIGDQLHYCTGPRTHVRNTSEITDFRLVYHFIRDPFNHSYLLVGCVGENAEANIKSLARFE